MQGWSCIQSIRNNMGIDLKVDFLGKKLNSPVIIASGVGGYCNELEEFFDFSLIGAITTKTITPNPREGNPPPRIVEMPFGIINSIGLANVGVEKFIKEKMPLLKKLNTKKIVSIGGENEEDFKILAKRLSSYPEIDFLEINLSCPNIGKDILFSQDEKAVKRIIKKVKKVTNIPVIAKLSPQVSNIREIAIVCEKEGADAINIGNTLPVELRDFHNKKYVLGGKYGGLSGPCIKPLILKLIEESRKHVNVPIIATGGIYSGKDALEYLSAGAKCISLGSVILLEPSAPVRILEEIKEEFKFLRVKSVKEFQWNYTF